MITKAIIGILVLALIGSVAALGVVYQNLQASQASLSLNRAELETAKNTLDSYRELNQGLTSANDGLLAKIQAQAVQIHHLESTNSDLVAESRRIYQEIQRVEELNTSLDQENRQLTANNNSLEREVREVTNDNNSLNQENRNLTARSNQFEADNERLYLELEMADENARTLQVKNDQQTIAIHTLEGENTKLTANVNELEGQNHQLGQQNVQQAAAIQTLEQEKTKLTSDVTELRGQNQSLATLNETYRNKSGTVNQLNTKLDSLRAEIRRLENQRKPLLVESFTTGFKCTGSMEPKITCLDSATMLRNFRPQDISVGTSISFRPTAACELTGGRVLHRVMKVKVERGIYYYWPKGDNNSGPDDCWIPESNVNGYIIELHKNTDSQNAELRNAVNAAYADMKRKRNIYYARRSAYGCPDPNRVCTVSPGKFRELSRLRADYLDAVAYHRCWSNAARTALYSNFGPPVYPLCIK